MRFVVYFLVVFFMLMCPSFFYISIALYCVIFSMYIFKLQKLEEQSAPFSKKVIATIVLLIETGLFFLLLNFVLDAYYFHNMYGFEFLYKLVGKTL